jgi:hypothetical protein
MIIRKSPYVLMTLAVFFHGACSLKKRGGWFSTSEAKGFMGRKRLKNLMKRACIRSSREKPFKFRLSTRENPPFNALCLGFDDPLFWFRLASIDF